MNETAARQVWLARSCETAPPFPGWTDEDRLWADQAAARRVGEGATPESFVVQRSALVSERLEARDATVRRVQRSVSWRPWIGPMVVAAALVAGLATDALSAGTRINVLAPPLLGVLAWNLAVYGLLAARALSALAAGRSLRRGWLTRVVSRLGRGGLGHGGRGSASGGTVASRFLGDWLSASAPLNGARAAAVLHAAAAALAIGLLAGLYLRGLAFEYRAGWDSTFLGPSAVRRLLGIVLGPASAVTGIALPDVPGVASIRFSAGPGENAARWIHLYAATVLLFVGLPRTLLALRAAWQAHRLAREFPIPSDDAYVRSLERRWRGQAARVQVLPFSYQVPQSSLRGLQARLAAELGPDVELVVAPCAVPPDIPSDTASDTAPDTASDTASDTAHGGPFVLVVALFNLGATPEVETHVAFVQGLAQDRDARRPLRVIVDETRFRERFAADPRRIDERRAAWRKAMAETGCEPQFATLGDAS
jgi:hypothetical protein